jgi:hypothetical protein
MSKKDITDLKKFLQPYPSSVQELALWLRGFVWDLYRESNELVYDNYNAVAFGWSLSDRLSHTFCSIALFPNPIQLKGATITKSIYAKKKRPGMLIINKPVSKKIKSLS